MSIAFLQLNIDHARLASQNLGDRMTETGVPLAPISGQYRPGGKLPKMTPGFNQYAIDRDPAVAVVTRGLAYDVSPLLTSKLVVAVYCEARDFQFAFISAYAPPHRSMDDTFRGIEEAIAKSRTPNVIVPDDFNAKHPAWGPCAGDERGAHLMEFAAANRLVVLNDPSIATDWIVREDLTFSEHKNIEVHIGATRERRSRRLTRYAREDVLDALGREPRFSRVLGADVRSPDALEELIAGFQRLFDRLYRANLRPVKSPGKPWWTPALAREKRSVNALRRRYQRCRAEKLRAQFRADYSRALAGFRSRVGEAKASHLRSWYASCTRRSIFSAAYREAFGRVRPRPCLPPLELPDGTRSTTHLESAALFLATQIAVDEPSSDGPRHAEIRVLAASPYRTRASDAPFTAAEIESVLRKTTDASAPGPDKIGPYVIKGLARIHGAFQLKVDIGGGTLVDETIINQLCRACDSGSGPGKFARALLRDVFPEEELRGKSLFGGKSCLRGETRQKEALDPARVEADTPAQNFRGPVCHA
ncbi:uncharacterized protein LOC142563476 [Dermacentor variabilis]|uniref:uncharacterized protein LOC142563476 n=1 Tax=Dermacentor variabilis TaxID=34621 RepID=UPI003F5AF011